MKTVIVTTLCCFSFALRTLHAAPPISDCQATLQRDLGLWDDVFVIEQWDHLILRRGGELFAMDLSGNGPPELLVASPRLLHSQFVAGVPVQQRLWLLLTSKQSSPFAIDVNSGQVAEFEIPGLKFPAEQTAVIESHVIVVPHCSAALLTVAGGDRDSWPRDGNRPVCFWLDLDSGEVIRLPIGWDFSYFSQDQRVAVFTAPTEERFQLPPLQAVEMATGRQLGIAPERSQQGYVPLVWTGRQALKPVRAPAVKPGAKVRLRGVSVGGQVYPVPEALNAGDRVASAETRDNVLGLRIRPTPQLDYEPCDFWLLPMRLPAEPRLVAEDVAVFAMLDGGNSVFVSPMADRQPAEPGRAEAFVYRFADGSTWNVLAGAPRLPELGPELTDKGYVYDSRHVRLIAGFGTGKRMVLCLFTHHRYDRRSPEVLRFGPKDQPAKIEPAFWRRAVVVHSDGRRGLLNLLRDNTLTDHIWLHNSGRLITAEHQWQDAVDGSHRHVNVKIFGLPAAE